MADVWHKVSYLQTYLFYSFPWFYNKRHYPNSNQREIELTYISVAQLAKNWLCTQETPASRRNFGDRVTPLHFASAAQLSKGSTRNAETAGRSSSGWE